ncbi:MAG TPA: TadE/TadG family type IV pilus assembly protein [Terriglobales bacterium]
MRRVQAYLHERRGTAAAEMALWLVIMIWPFMNAVDFGYYVFQAMEVRQAAQAAVDTAATMCGQSGKSPAASQCQTLSPTLISEMTTAAQSTLLGTRVSFTAGTTAGNSDSAPFEGYYCNNSSGNLVVANSATNTATSPWLINGGTVATEPSNCAFTATNDADVPGDYVIATTTYNYKPLFKGLTLLTLFNGSVTKVTKTAWMRIA